MKKSVIILANCLLFIALAKNTIAQSYINAEEKDLLVNGISMNVISAPVIGNTDEVYDFAQKFAKDEFDAKLKKEDNLLIAKEITIGSITDKRGDLIIYSYNDEKNSVLNMAFKVGYDIYLNSKQFPAETEKLKDLFKYFLSKYYQSFLPKYIKEKQKNLKEYTKQKVKAEKVIQSKEKENIKLNKRNEKISKKIRNLNDKAYNADVESKKTQLKNKVKTLESVIAENEKTIENNTNLIASKQSIIETLTPKIEDLTKEIDNLNLTLLEADAIIKINKNESSTK
jgi:uncharacterized coiled-coil protein SlyX